jgi:hypothetical protein
MKKSDNQSLIPNLFIEYFKCIVTGRRVPLKPFNGISIRSKNLTSLIYKAKGKTSEIKTKIQKIAITFSEVTPKKCVITGSNCARVPLK